MYRYNNFIDQLKSGSCMIINGATGTEIEKRGVPQLSNAWNGGGALSRPDILLQVYKDYIGAGAQLIISNTFANSKHALEQSGELENFYLLNSRGVELAVTAREQLKKSEILRSSCFLKNMAMYSSGTIRDMDFDPIFIGFPDRTPVSLLRNSRVNPLQI